MRRQWEEASKRVARGQAGPGGEAGAARRQEGSRREERSRKDGSRK